jgi:citrate synthase
MSEPSADAARQWWSTSIIDIHPGKIGIRGYPIEQLIGELTFVEMIWLMLRGERPPAAQARLLEAALVAAVDHGPQAPSIATARMAITCGVGLNNAMASGINALGDVHGGAGQQCMELYAEIDAGAANGMGIEPAAAVAIGRALSAGRHLPGFGHRFHPIDPRTVRLLALLDDAAAAGTISGRFVQIGRAAEKALHDAKGKFLPMNIDGVTAVVFCELGFEPPHGRGLFVLSRSVGILSHAMEQMGQGGRIKGPMPPGIPYTYSGEARRNLEPTS